MTSRHGAVLERHFGGRDFALLWSGFTVNVFGTAVTGIALPLVALVTLDASTFALGVVSAAGLVSWLLFGLSAGVLVDRFPRRLVLVTCDVFRAVAVLSVPVVAVTGRLTLGQLVLVAFAVGVASVFYDIGVQTYVPVVVEPPGLIVANSRLQGSQSVSQVAGPSLGGGLTQLLGAPFALLADAASYAVSACSLLAIRQSESVGRPETPPKMLAQIREGLAFVLRDHPLRALTLTAAVINVLGVALETLVMVFLVRTLELSAGLVGLLLASGGVGGLAGALAAGTLGERLGGARALRLAVLSCPLAALLVPLATRGAGLLLIAAGLMALSGLTVVFGVIARTYRQLVTPGELLGRVTATMRFVSWGVLPFGALAAGALGEWVGPRPALGAVCVAFVLLPVPLLTSPLRNARDLPHRERTS
jgi:MFS family permease